MKFISAFSIAFLLIGCLLLAIPEKGYTQPGVGCCQLFGDEGFECETTSSPGDAEECIFFGGEVLEGEECNMDTGLCSGFTPTKNVPSLSHWGLIALAGVLGVFALFVIARRQTAS